MHGLLITVTLIALNAGGEPTAQKGRHAREAPALREELPSCEDAPVFVRDGKYFRVVRGALVACDPLVPPAV